MIAQKDVTFLVKSMLGDEACAVAAGGVLVFVQGKGAAGVKYLI